MKVLMAVGGFPTSDRPQSGLFNQVAAEKIGKEVDLTVVHFRYWKPGRKFIEVIDQEDYNYIKLCIPTVPVWHQKWNKIHFTLYVFFIKKLIGGYLKKFDLVHCVQGEIGIWFSKLKQHYDWKLVVQFIGTDLVSEFRDYRKKAWVDGWQKKADAVTFNSMALNNLFFQYYPDFKGIARTIYRGVDLRTFKPYSKKPGPYTFLFLGGLANYKFEEGRNLKGGLDLLNAWVKISESDLVNSIRLRFAGVDAVPNVINEYIGHEQLKNFEAIGPLIKQQVIHEYQKCDVVIVPSLQDGLPNVSVEAQACGKPVIGANVGGIPEVIVHRETGFLFQSGNKEQLLEYIKSLFLDPDLYQKMSKAARIRVKSNFNADQFGKKYFEFYCSVCVE